MIDMFGIPNNMDSWLKCLVLGLCIIGAAPRFAAATDADTIDVSISEHRFQPTQIEVPASKKVQLKIKNLDPTPEEFESYDLNREKTVTGNGEISVFVGPLEPGEYKFFGEFNPDTAQGTIVVR